VYPPDRTPCTSVRAIRASYFMCAYVMCASASDAHLLLPLLRMARFAIGMGPAVLPELAMPSSQPRPAFPPIPLDPLRFTLHKL
jgi:hypothetical protein